MKWEAQLRRGRELWEKYRPVFLVLAIGVLLLLWPGGGGETDSPTAEGSQENWFDLTETEEKFAHALSQIDGAGDVTVVLTIKEGPRRVVAEDSRAEKGERELSRETSTVLISQGSGREEAMELQQLGPTYQGALVVAQGAGDAEIRLALSQAVCALTGLRSDQITIWKGK